MKKIWVLLIIFSFLLLSLWWYKSKNRYHGKLRRTEINYGSEISQLAKQFQLSSAYFKALIALECSGLKRVPPRFERHIYKILKQVQLKKRQKYEFIRYNMIKDATDGALKNLARSWGPFQIMGYKCLYLGIKVKDLRGENALYWGMKWINLTYGDYLRKKRFQDAFHIHNTGEKYPLSGLSKTYDPNYVKNGLRFIAYYQRNTQQRISVVKQNFTLIPKEKDNAYLALILP